MRHAIAISTMLMTFAACGDKQAEPKPGARAADLSTPEGVFAAARERTDTMCACANEDCRIALAAHVDDPFGDKARDVRERFNPEQVRAWNALLARWAECALRN
jgi:hypothetical protein